MLNKCNIRILIIIVLGMLSFESYAVECGVSAAKVTKVHQYHDGSVFVYFDKDSDCDCSIKDRLAFSNDKSSLATTTAKIIESNKVKFFISASLTALTTGTLVGVRAEDRDENGNCPIHGNTAEAITFVIN